MKKVSAVIFIVIILSFSCFSAYADSEITEGRTGITINYAKYIVNEMSFDYDDAYFNASPSVFSPALAKVSVFLSSLVHSQAQAENVFSQMGYEILGEYNYGKAYTVEDCGYTAFMIGRKKAVFSDGKMYWIYIAAIRGTNGMEWYSNFDIGTDTDHAGFTHAAKDVMEVISSVVDTPKESNKFLITGHSRGAAVANLVAHELVSDSVFAKKENVFGYTFACPTVTRAPSEEDAVFNINNPGDVVPLLPLPGWGYARHGKDIVLPTDEATMKALNAIMTLYSGSPYTGKTDFSEFEANALKWCPTVEDFYKERPLSPSPSECIGGFAEALISGDYSGIIKMVSPFVADQNARNTLTYLFENMSEIGTGHSPLTYICWLYAVYPEDVDGIQITPYNGEYDGKAHPVCEINASDNSREISYSEDGIEFTKTMPEIKDAGEYKFFVLVSGEDGNFEKKEFLSCITPKTIDVSGVKLKNDTFTYDGTPHTPEIIGIPDELSFTASGILTETNAGSHTIYVGWESKDPNFVPSAQVTELTWKIKKAVYDTSNIEWDYEKPFEYDGKEHKVSLTGLPDGVTAVYAGTFEASEKRSYTAKAGFEYDSKNYYSPYVEDLEWEIKSPDFPVITVVCVSGAAVIAVIAAAIAVKRKKK